MSFYSKKTDWIALEFNAVPGNPNAIDRYNDGMLLTTNRTTEGGDIYFIGTGFTPIFDERNDVFYEIIDKDDNFKFMEIRRLLNTTDEDGFDIILEERSYNIKLVSNNRPGTHNIGIREIYNLTISNTLLNKGLNTTDSISLENSSNDKFNHLNSWFQGVIGLNIIILIGTLVVVRKSR